jgi:hypothetical protein
MILIRYILVGLVIVLIARAFMQFGEGKESSPTGAEPDKKDNASNKKISKEIGEYVDYEEVDN